MSTQDVLRQELFAELDAVEATTKQLVGDQSREAVKAQNAIIDGVNVQRHTVSAIPLPRTECGWARAAMQKPDAA